MAIIVSASILSADFTNLGRDVKMLCDAGVDMIHFDVMDGSFVPNITLGSLGLRSIKPLSSVWLDVHLMVVNPESHIEHFAKAGADIITFHIEATQNPLRCIEIIRSFGIRAGISLRPQTSLDKITEIIPMVDSVLIMTVNPGAGGQEFMSDQLEKISQIRRIIRNLGIEVKICVDGGVNEKTAAMAVAAGADTLVSGSYIFASGNLDEIRDRIKILRGV